MRVVLRPPEVSRRGPALVTLLFALAAAGLVTVAENPFVGAVLAALLGTAAFFVAFLVEAVRSAIRPRLVSIEADEATVRVETAAGLVTGPTTRSYLRADVDLVVAGPELLVSAGGRRLRAAIPPDGHPDREALWRFVDAFEPGARRDLPPVLDLARTDVSHESATYTIRPAFDPPNPRWLLAAGVGFAVLSVPIAIALAWERLQHELLALGAGLAAAAGVFGLTVGFLVALPPHRLVLEVSSHRLRLRVHTAFRVRERQMLLATVRSVDLRGGARLRFVTDDGPVDVRLPERSRATRDALQAFLDEHLGKVREQLGQDRDVPQGLRRLVAERDGR